ncbi:MAG TPA: hypothetical protein VG965_02490 [Patescibacteria group bacterium]|nr:hypothetical protein [Patescibacteria group bacterium]
MSKFRVTLEIGDEVAYELGEDSDGRPKAFPWIYKSHWDKAAEHIASRPVYRVRDSRGDAAGNMNEPTTLWEGTNLDDAFNRYRIPSFRHINGLPFHDSDDIFSHRQWFEKKGQDDPDDEWEECSNPFPSWEQSR